MASGKAEKEVSEKDSFGSLITMMENMMMTMDENNRKDMAERRKHQKEATSMVAKFYEAQEKLVKAQRMCNNAAFPKYEGRAEEFDDWEHDLRLCIQFYGWKNEKRELDILPSCLKGTAELIFRSLPAEDKMSLNSVLAALKKALDPRGAERNRRLFMQAKRNPGETMCAFVNRCNEYLVRSRDDDAKSDTSWANSLIVRKIYAGLNVDDKKMLKGLLGKSEDVPMLCRKADELIRISNEAIRSCQYEWNEDHWLEQPDSPDNYSYKKSRLLYYENKIPTPEYSDPGEENAYWIFKEEDEEFGEIGEESQEQTFGVNGGITSDEDDMAEEFWLNSIQQDDSKRVRFTEADDEEANQDGQIPEFTTIFTLPDPGETRPHLESA